MARFSIGTPIPTETPTITVDVGPDNPLLPGKHTFQLVVQDNAGNASAPTSVVVIVADLERPTAMLEAPPTVRFNESFTLRGDKSFDSGGGKIATYIFTYLGPV